MDGTYVVEVVNDQIVNYKPFDQAKDSGGLWFTGILLWVALIAGSISLFFGAVFIVRQQSVEIIERFGRFVRVSRAGLRFKIPFVERRAGDLDLRIQELAEQVVVKSSDNAFVTVPVKVQYRVLPEKVKEAFYELADANKQIKSYIVNIVRSTATQLDMDAVFKSKDKFEQDVQQDLNAKFGGFGYEIVNVLVDDPIPSKEVIEASNRVIASKREMEAAQNEAEAIRLKTVAVAQAEAESLVLKAEAYVKQRAAVIEGFKGILTGMSNEAILEYLVGIDWRDAFRDVAKQGTTIIVPSPFDIKGDGISKMAAALKATE